MNGTKPDSEALYGEESTRVEKRYEHLRERYTGESDAAELRSFSSPDRAEIIDDHIDHNGDKVLAGSITLDTVCVAVLTDGGVVTIVSEGYRLAPANTKVLTETAKKDGSKSLVAGIAEAAEQSSRKAGGFRAYVTSEVIATAGVLSSASLEMPVCAILNAFYNNDKMSTADYIRMGRYAEGHWWNKASGLMDQMACTASGAIFLGFSEGIRCETIDFSFEEYGLSLFIVNADKGHADLTEEYPTIPRKMYTAAGKLGEGRLADVRELILSATLSGIREKLGNNKALLHALHFFEKEGRVDEAREVVTGGDSDKFLWLVGESGKSSYEWLQDARCTENPKEQPILLALRLTELFLKCCVRGACRIHDDGFVGVIMAILSCEEWEDYTAFLSQYLGKENIYRMDLRRFSTIEVDS